MIRRILHAVLDKAASHAYGVTYRLGKWRDRLAQDPAKETEARLNALTRELGRVNARLDMTNVMVRTSEMLESRPIGTEGPTYVWTMTLAEADRLGLSPAESGLRRPSDAEAPTSY